MCRTESSKIGQATRQPPPDKNHLIVSAYLAKRLRKEESLFDALLHFGLHAKGSPPRIEVLASRLPTLFVALQEVGCTARDGKDGEYMVIEQVELDDTQAEAAPKDPSIPNQFFKSRPPSAQSGKGVARPSSAPACRKRHNSEVEEATRLKAEVEKDMEYPKVPMRLRLPQQTFDEQKKSVSRLAVPRRARPGPPSESSSSSQTKRSTAFDAEAQKNHCSRLSALPSRMQRSASEASLSGRIRPKFSSMLSPDEQDQLFARLAAPKRGEYTEDVKEFSDSDNETLAWAPKQQARPSSASQQRLCTRLAAPKKRMGRPQSAAEKPHFVDPAAQRALSRRLSEPKSIAWLKANAALAQDPNAIPTSKDQCEDELVHSQTDIFSAWGVFDEEKAAFWAQRQAQALEELEQAEAFNNQMEDITASAISIPTAPSRPTNRHPVPKLPPLESLVRIESSFPHVPKLPSLESLAVREQWLQQKYENDPLDSDLETSDTASSLTSSDLSSDFSSDRDHEGWAPDLSALPVQNIILPIQRPQCLATSENEESITRVKRLALGRTLSTSENEESISNGTGLVGWQLTRGCVPWA